MTSYEGHPLQNGAKRQITVHPKKYKENKSGQITEVANKSAPPPAPKTSVLHTHRCLCVWEGVNPSSQPPAVSQERDPFPLPTALQLMSVGFKGVDGGQGGGISKQL